MAASVHATCGNWSTRVLLYCWLLVTEIAACGKGYLYLFWDSNCGNEDHHEGWILSLKPPNPKRSSNLHNARDGGCHNWANLAGSHRNLPRVSRWQSYDGCCANAEGTEFQVSIDKVGATTDVKISGLCNVAGGMKWANQIYNMSGTTTGGRPWYTSAKYVEEFDGEDLHGPAIFLLIIVMLLCMIGVCITICSVCACYYQKTCCFQHLQHQQTSMPPVVIGQPGGAVVGQVVVGQPVAVQVPGKATSSCATVVQAQVIDNTHANTNTEGNPNLVKE